MFALVVKFNSAEHWAYIYGRNNASAEVLISNKNFATWEMLTFSDFINNNSYKKNSKTFVKSKNKNPNQILSWLPTLVFVL